VNEDDALAEIATDKVDSEIPSPVEGILEEILFNEGDVVPVGKVIAVINLGGESSATETTGKAEGTGISAISPIILSQEMESPIDDPGTGDRFYSPLVKSIARGENLTASDLARITGSGKDGRVTKNDVLNFLKNKPVTSGQAAAGPVKPAATFDAPKVFTDSGDEVFEMDRMRRLIADHMVMSKQVSPHVTSFIDVDVSRVVQWREKVKESLLAREKEKLTYTHILIEAAVTALKDFPRVNASVDGYKIIHRKKINIGMATALPNGNLIVPVIRNADQKSLLGIVKDVNDLAGRARKNSLLPDEIQGGTFTITNFGTFDSLSGTPIINQPQVAILGTGAIRKKPVVIETPQGDLIGIRHIMILSLAYDHRVVDGALGGMFLKRMKEILENWDMNRSL
jgi:2-oxoglutarate dehydrogenase E2 component (dihydrolipoamide succinyltransferase)